MNSISDTELKAGVVLVATSAIGSGSGFLAANTVPIPPDRGIRPSGHGHRHLSSTSQSSPVALPTAVNKYSGGQQ
jgi:hypothetical protein